VGLFLVVAVLLLIKGRMEPPASVVSSDPSAPAAVQFAQARAAEQPTLLFFHSNSCESCVTMTRTIGDVWPAFQPQVALVSVNVYDQQNLELLQTQGIRVIPTMVFIDRNGARQVEIGTMRPEVLQQRLAALAAGG
jgi:thioredoxin-like negative regulator of GroEL